MAAPSAVPDDGHGADETGSCPALTAREAELLTLTLEILRETGYDRLTVDAVAARAHASKATIYRRWPSKADLVVAAFTHGVRQAARASDTGTLRGDLMQLAGLIAEQTRLHGSTVAAMLPEIRRSPRLRAVFEHEFYDRRRTLIQSILRRAACRGEIAPQVISDEIWDVLPGYLVFRALVPGRPPTAETLQALVDEVLLPSLTRQPAATAAPAAAADNARGHGQARRTPPIGQTGKENHP